MEAKAEKQKKYEKIIRLIARRPTITSTTCLAEYPEIAHGTFYKIMSALNKHNLLEKIPCRANRTRMSYRKTTKFTIEKAIEVAKIGMHA